MSDEREMPWYEIGAIYDYFGYKNRRAALNAIKDGRFPAPTYILAGRMRIIDSAVLQEFFQRKEQAGLDQLS